MTIRRQTQIIFPSVARTASCVSPVFSAEEVLSSVFVLDVTEKTATPSVVATIQGIDPLNGAVYTILATAAFTNTGTLALEVGPSIIAAANASANKTIPAEFKVTMAHNDGDSITYSLSVTHVVQN